MTTEFELNGHLVVFVKVRTIEECPRHPKPKN